MTSPGDSSEVPLYGMPTGFFWGFFAFASPNHVNRGICPCTYIQPPEHSCYSPVPSRSPCRRSHGRDRREGRRWLAWARPPGRGIAGSHGRERRGGAPPSNTTFATLFKQPRSLPPSYKGTPAFSAPPCPPMPSLCPLGRPSWTARTGRRRLHVGWSTPPHRQFGCPVGAAPMALDGGCPVHKHQHQNIEKR